MYTHAETYSPRPATKSMPAYISNVHCSGEELTLLDCSYSGNLSSNDHSKDIGIRCEMGEMYLHVPDTRLLKIQYCSLV